MKPTTLGTIAFIVGVVICLAIGLDRDDTQALLSFILEAFQ